MKSAGFGARDQTWRHHKRNWVRGFEHALSAVLGLGWWAEAKNAVAKAGRKGNLFSLEKPCGTGKDQS